MKRLEETLELSGSCFYTMLRSVIEPLNPKNPKESVGDLLGRKIKEIYIGVNSYPWITALRKTGGTTYYDEEAERIRRFNRAVNTKGGLGTYVIGGYHSHYHFDYEPLSLYLSNPDIYQSIVPEMEELKKSYWIEVILGIREIKYKHPKKIGESIKKFKKRMRVSIIDSPFHEYRITISAYKITNPKKPKIKEIKVRKRKVKVTPMG